MASLMSAIKASTGREFIYSIPYDADLLLALKDLAKKMGVATGVINFIGALRRATLLYYVQEEKRFHKNILEGPLEIASGIGNIAILDGDHVIHCHVVLADKNGNCFGGHLAEGSSVFAAEVHIRELSPQLQRKIRRSDRAKSAAGLAFYYIKNGSSIVFYKIKNDKLPQK